MIQLQPMTEEEFRQAMERAVPRHAANCVRRGQWTPELALEASRKEIAARHPDGVRTAHQTFLTVVDDSVPGRVGETWYVSELQGGKVRFWVDWIWIDPPYRRRGYASQVLELLAEEAVRHGADRIGLYVFADNPGAMALYAKLGFQTQSMGMVKELAGEPDVPRRST